jgi:hypothetical protein
MNQFIVNGVSQPSPLSTEENFRSLLAHIHEHLIHETALVSSIKVNGLEINAKDESVLSQVTLSDLESVEVTLVHPREMAEDTLQTLLLFTERLADMSRRTAEELGQLTTEENFTRLTDGIETFVHSLHAAKTVLRIGTLPAADILERDMLSLMKDILECRKSNNVDYLIALLSEHLPINLHDWCVSGIPAIIRSRDS